MQSQYMESFPRKIGDNFIKPQETWNVHLPLGGRGLNQMGVLKFSTLFGWHKAQSFLKSVCLFQKKFNISIEDNFFRVVTRHQKYINPLMPGGNKQFTHT